MFERLIGNEKIKEDLNLIIKEDNIFHSYMFIGTEGIGKKKFAKEFAKGILCLDKNKPCEKCKSCLEFDNNNNPDFYYIGLGEENSIKIDTIREMQKKIQELPIVSTRKVYIIDDFEYVTREAQNCLLKTIEEPPEFVTIILITANESKILNTIKSRCLKINFKNIETNKLKDFLEKNYKINSISENEIRLYNGSIGKAILLKDKQELYASIDKIFNNIENLNLIDTLNTADIIYKSQEDKYDILEYINIILFKKLKYNINYINTINIVEDAKKRLKANSNYNMTIDNLIMTIWEEIH